MTVRQMPPDSWGAELDSFSRRHAGWLVSIKTRAADGSIAIGAHDLPLLGVSRASRDSKHITIAVGDADGHLIHDVHDATALGVELTGDLAERGLVIDAADGSTTSVEFRSAVRVEEVDGIAATGRS